MVSCRCSCVFCQIHPCYPLVNVYITMENHNFPWENPLFLWPFSIAMLHPYAQVLAMFAFDSYSQSKRSPRPLSRHRPCKTPFPIGNASFNKPWPNYHGSIMFYSFFMVLLCSIRFWSNPIGTPVSNGPFFVGTVDAHKQKREAGPFPSLYTAGWVLIKEKNEVQNEVQNEVKTRYGKSPASTHMDFGPQAANLPFLGSLVAKQWQFAESQHTAMAV